MPDNPNPSLLPSADYRIDAVCQSFEEAWKAGQRPRLEDYLGSAEGPERRALLRELLSLEWEYRTRIGEQPTAEEYRTRFPDAVGVIDSLLASAPMKSCPSPARLIGGEPSPVLTRYEVLEEVGRGGMGVVHRGRHRLLDQQVAVKFCLPGREVERFQREAKILSSVRSPYLVAVRDFELLPDGRAMLVMDWVEGRDLGKVFRTHNGPLPEGRVVSWMSQVCEGMQAAANRNIVHRDLKPANILVDHRDQARVADFGLARAAGDDHLSVTGEMMGTPLYMAPEQAEDPRGVDTRADIYSFGATFYHVLTGKPPFEGETAFSILYKHKTQPLVTPRTHRPGLSERTCDLLERCLAKAPADRFPSFEELRKHLQSDAVASSPWAVSDDHELAPYLSRYEAGKERYLGDRGGWNEDLDVYAFPRGQTLRIIRGDLVKQRVDALVNSDTCDFDMDAGVSAAIRVVGGPEILDQLARQKPVRPGRAVVTTAGNLPARLVFHGGTAGSVGGRFVFVSRDLITEIMTSCFYHADSYEMRSIAFPLLGTGGMGFPREICLDTMFQFLARILLRGLTSIRDARIVIYRSPESSWRA
jgi:O-acetyl-ADP-ribose deacetylase (regulator of RNase III)/tRNA A-37 threonylcarbamoyl transferase component Bud32